MQLVSSRIFGLLLTRLWASGAALAKREGPVPGNRG
jgi:hypothetical protein